MESRFESNVALLPFIAAFDEKIYGPTTVLCMSV